MGYIYLNFGDLNEEAQEELKDCASDQIDKDELKRECEENGRDYEYILIEKIDSELLNLSIVFNI